MNDFLQSLLNLLTFGLICGPVAIFLPLYVISMVAKITRSQHASKRLAGALKIGQLNRESHFLKAWYGGRHLGYDFGFVTTSRITRGTRGDGRSSITVHYETRMAMAVPKTAWQGEALTDAGQIQADADLPDTAKTEMQRFIDKGLPARLLPPQIRTGKKARHLALVSRQAATDDMLPADVFTNAAAVLVHHNPYMQNPIPDMQALFDHMALITQLLEGRHADPALERQVQTYPSYADQPAQVKLLRVAGPIVLVAVFPLSMICGLILLVISSGIPLR
jgi:hypothetical protein